MSVTRERLAQGLSYPQFVAVMTKNQDRLTASEAQVHVSQGNLTFFAGLPHKLDVVVLAEDWCGDVIANLPVLQQLAEQTGKFSLHIFLRDQNDDLMQLFLKDGKHKSIPVFAFFDDNLTELGRFIERPPAFNTLRADRRTALYAAHPEIGAADTPVDDLTDDQRQARQRLLGELEQSIAQDRIRMVIQDIRAICEKAVPAVR